MTTAAIALAPQSGTQLVWCQPTTANDAWTLAQTIHDSGLAPKDYNTPAKIFIAMQHGAELGLNAMQALQGIAMVNGRPAVWGTLLQSLVMRSGITKRRLLGAVPLSTARKIADGKWKGRTEGNAVLIDALAVAMEDRMDDLKDRKVTMVPEYLCGYAVFQIGEDVHVHLFDSAHAQKAGLLGKSGPWTQYPQRMHQHRAFTYLARDLCGTALTGLAGQPTAEELMDMEAVDATVTEVVRQVSPVSSSARMADMAATPAGAAPPAPAPDGAVSDKVAARNRLAAAVDRLKTMVWEDGRPMPDEMRKAMIAAKYVEAFGGPRAVAQMSPNDCLLVASKLDAIVPPVVVDTTATAPEPEADGEPAPDDRTNF